MKEPDALLNAKEQCKMKIFWLIYNISDSEKNQAYIQFYKEEGQLLGYEMKLLLVERCDFGVKNGATYFNYNGTSPKKPEFAIVRTIYPLLNQHLELMGIETYNNSMVSTICNDKARTYQYLAGTGIPMVDSRFVKKNYYSDIIPEYKNHKEFNHQENHINQFVIKAVEGHGGSQVFLYSDQEADVISQKLLGSDVVIQPLTGSRHQDLRVYVIGTEVIAAVLRTAKEGFRANFSLGGSVRLYELTAEDRSIVQKIISKFDFGLVGIDFIIGDSGELIFNEIEDVVGARMLYQCSDINLVRNYLQYIIQTKGVQ